MMRTYTAAIMAFLSGMFAGAYDCHVAAPTIGPTPAAAFALITGLVALVFVFLPGLEGWSS